MDDREPISAATAFEQASESAPRCAHPDCEALGRYRAPLSPKAARDFVWLCLDHVRAHNAAWDYFAGMDAAEIEAKRRADSLWERPTWRFGSLGNWQATAEYRFDEGFGHFGNGKTGGTGSDGRNGPARLNAKQRQALSVLGLEPGASKKEIKARYKSLAKKLHPDANGHDPKAEERLKRVNQAYHALKSLA